MTTPTVQYQKYPALHIIVRLRLQRRSLVYGEPFYNISLTKYTEQLKKKWTSMVYAFFKPNPVIKEVGNNQIHAFKCNPRHCKSYQ